MSRVGGEAEGGKRSADVRLIENPRGLVRFVASNHLTGCKIASQIKHQQSLWLRLSDDNDTVILQLPSNTRFGQLLPSGIR